MQPRGLARRAAAGVLGALLALPACADDNDDTTDAAPLGSGSNGDEAGVEASSDLEREGSGAVSDLEREVSEALTVLEAEARDGDTVVILPDRVLFAFGEHELLPDAVPVLDHLVLVIDFFADASVQVNGHTDAVGPEAGNQTLSERRARAVVEYLTSAGIDPTRVRARGFGETQPVTPNTHDDGSDNPDGRAQNRRVEIIIEGADLSSLDP